jgi:hypothetical protein
LKSSSSSACNRALQGCWEPFAIHYDDRRQVILMSRFSFGCKLPTEKHRFHGILTRRLWHVCCRPCLARNPPSCLLSLKHGRMDRRVAGTLHIDSAEGAQTRYSSSFGVLLFFTFHKCFPQSSDFFSSKFLAARATFQPSRGLGCTPVA